MTTKERYDQQSDVLNAIAIIISAMPELGLTYEISETMPEDEIPEGANLEYGINSAAEIVIYREIETYLE